jgi:exodeoxyribonuclease VII large subunit
MEDRLFDPTPTLSVSEVLSRARVVVERAFGDEVWIEGEIQALRRTDTHVYFDLVEARDDGRPAARLPVILFETNRRGVNVLLRRAGGAVRMDDGTQVRLRGSVSVYDRTGQVQLRMTAIDPTHTIGLLAAERDRILAALSAEGLLAANGRRALVGPPLRITLVTSRGSAAYEDFLHELTASGLGFRVRVHDVRVQGREAAPRTASNGPRPASTGRPAGRWSRAAAGSTGPTSSTRTWPGRSPAVPRGASNGPTGGSPSGRPDWPPTTPPARWPEGGRSPAPRPATWSAPPPMPHRTPPS